VTIEVTLAIDPAVVGTETTVATVADRLIEMGGPMIRWQPDLNGAPAKATFKFKNQARCDHFVADALAIASVSFIDASSATAAIDDVSASSLRSATKLAGG
jgi:hypothetical protein